MTAYKFEGYMGEKRKKLVEQFGYDTKNAAHLVRLLRMGIEVLREGKVNVSRKGTDAEDLLDIKRGKWSLEDVKREYQRLKAEIDDAVLISGLPKKPDREKVNNLLTDIIFGYHL